MANEKLNYKIIPAEPTPYTTNWFLLHYFEDWTVEDIETAIEKDFQWDIAGCGNQIVDHVVTQFVNWAKEFRPEFVGPLSSWKGKKWLHKNIRTMITQI